jgi:hypothetical protein
LSSFGGGGSSGPTPQQVQLETQQAVTNATLNNEENLQRKTILNAMQGTRVFRGSALSRALAGNSPGSAAMSPAPGPGVPTGSASFVTRGQQSLLDLAPGSGATSAGGAGTSNPGSAPLGGYAGGIGAGGGGRRGGGPQP